MNTSTAKAAVQTALAPYVNASKAGLEINLQDVQDAVNNIIMSLAALNFPLYDDQGDLVQGIELVEDEDGDLVIETW